VVRVGHFHQPVQSKVLIISKMVN